MTLHILQSNNPNITVKCALDVNVSAQSNNLMDPKMLESVEPAEFVTSGRRLPKHHALAVGVSLRSHSKLTCKVTYWVTAVPSTGSHRATFEGVNQLGSARAHTEIRVVRK